MLSFANENLKNKIGYVRESLLQTEKFYLPAFEIEQKESLCQGKEGINAGFFICDASLFKKYMRIWGDAHKYFCSKNKKFIKRNQSVFNYLIETGVFNSQELPKYYVEFPEYYLKKDMTSEYDKRINETNILYHIVGTSDRNVHKRMKYYYRQELKKANLPDRTYEDILSKTKT